MNENDPSDVFRADQTEAASRDQVAWTLNVETTHADLAMKASHTQHTIARATFWNALGFLLLTVAATIWVGLVALIVRAVFL